MPKKKGNQLPEPPEEAKQEINDEPPKKSNKPSILKHFWVVLTVAVIIILAVSLTYHPNPKNIISEEEAGDIVVEFIKSRFNEDVSVLAVEPSGSLYKVIIPWQGQSAPVYITKDGENILDGMIPLTGMAAAVNIQNNESPSTLEPIEEASTPEGVISEEEAKNIIINFIRIRTGEEVEVTEVEPLGSLYKLTINFRGQTAPIYLTNDGENIAASVIPTKETDTPEQAPGQAPSQQPQTPQVPKSDKPEVELFVMTYCPYGTQAEKALIPAIEALGDKADIKIRFVHYFMHGEQEETETKRQLCVREESPDRFTDYLACFLEAGNSEECLEENSLNVEDCITLRRAEDYYEEDSTLSEGYGVRGSPTLVINGVQASFDRSPAGALNTICSAFNTAPEECSTELSAAPASPGFGYDGSSTGAAGSCS